MVRTSFRFDHALISLAGLALAAMLLIFGLATPANASESSYCGGQTLGAASPCVGAKRNMYAVSGYGTKSVCVWASNNPGGSETVGRTCSPGPYEGTYNSFATNQFYPVISPNTLVQSATVYGTAHQP